MSVQHRENRGEIASGKAPGARYGRALLVGSALLAGAAFIYYFGSTETPGTTSANPPGSAVEAAPEARNVTPIHEPTLRRAPRRRAAAAHRGATQVAAFDALAPSTPSPPAALPFAPQGLVHTAAPAPRVAQLHTSVLSEAQKYDWMYTDDQGTPCPAQRVRILWAAPDLTEYDRGAYFEPLGPAPSEASDSINGLLLCEGYNFLYRGFEAYYDEERGQWTVYPFPVIEEAEHEEQ